MNIPYSQAKKVDNGGGGTYDIMKGAASDHAGEAGLVPKPYRHQESLFLRGDGTWAAASGEQGFSPTVNVQSFQKPNEPKTIRVFIEDITGEHKFEFDTVWAQVQETPEGAVLTVKDEFETTSATIHNGEKGEKGEKGEDGKQGEDGFSPTITTEETEDGYDLTITNKTGSETIEIKNGEIGATPDMIMEVNVDSTTGTPDVEVTKAGTAERPVFNLQFSGLKGEKGEQGYSPTIRAEETATGHNVIITDESGVKTFPVKDGEDGAVGTTPNISANATITGTTGTPSVSVTKDGTLENPIFTFGFENLKGEQGIQGVAGRDGTNGTNGKDGKDGVTPDITMEVSVDDTSGTPSATVTRSGQLATPVYNVAFSGIKGYKGDRGERGETGSTPNISASATVDSSTGTPSVNVTKSGTVDNPSFAFAFSNLKGDKGDKGDDGTIGTTPDISATASVDSNVGTPSVSVTKSGDIHTPNFNFAFSNIKGQKGDKGDRGEKGKTGDEGFTPTITTAPTEDGYDITITNSTGSETIEIKNGEDGTVGATPNISATASVGQTTGTPSVNVTKSGDIHNPNFDFAFSNIRGQNGQDGQDGVSPTLSERKTTNGYDITITDRSGSRTISLTDGDTPDVGATASVNSDVGIPAVTVTKSGTASNPSFDFAFANLKGEKGDTGAQGVRGVQGEQGLPGVAGADGTTYTPEIGTITTVEAFDDADASVTIDGTRAIFDFSIPRGEKGESGASGVNILQYTMRLTGWVNGEYSFETQFPFARYNLEIEPDGDLITDQQLDAWNKGQMVGSFSANKCIAKGNTPTIDIPIILKAQSKGA